MPLKAKTFINEGEVVNVFESIYGTITSYIQKITCKRFELDY